MPALAADALELVALAAAERSLDDLLGDAGLVVRLLHTPA